MGSVVRVEHIEWTTSSSDLQRAVDTFRREGLDVEVVYGIPITSEHATFIKYNALVIGKEKSDISTTNNFS